MRIKYSIIITIFILSGCITTGGKPEKIDFSLYQGTWYEIARLPNSFEEGLKCITATYSYNDEGIILLTNKGISRSNPDDIKTLTGRAWIPDPEHPENLKVQFIWPVTTDYWVVHVDSNKGYAIIGSPSRKRLWFLSRKESIDEADFPALKRIAEKNQFKTDSIVMVEHNCGKQSQSSMP